MLLTPRPPRSLTVSGGRGAGTHDLHLVGVVGDSKAEGGACAALDTAQLHALRVYLPHGACVSRYTHRRTTTIKPDANFSELFAYFSGKNLIQYDLMGAGAPLSKRTGRAAVDREADLWKCFQSLRNSVTVEEHLPLLEQIRQRPTAVPTGVRRGFACRLQNRRTPTINFMEKYFIQKWMR